MREKGAQNVAVEDAYTTSQCGNSVTPMPIAGPFTAATIFSQFSTNEVSDRLYRGIVKHTYKLGETCECRHKASHGSISRIPFRRRHVTNVRTTCEVVCISRKPDSIA